jgi:protein arginine N-methyltransferase 1
MLDPVELFPEIPNLYQFPSVHAGMLYDEERVAKYSAAINQVVKKGDVVADIGTGTGLLAFLCLKAGAKRVHAIERSSAIDWAKRIADKNGLSDRIIFHNQDSRDCDLPEKVNVVVSELIGHIAFEEGMAESLVDARERFLVANGVMLPERVDLKVALVEENEVYPECIECWQDIEGIDYSLMREEAVKACYLTSLSHRDLLSEPKTFFKANFKEKCQLNLQASHSFNVCRSGKINGIALWFEAVLSPNVTLSSGPLAQTHWKQCFAPLITPIDVNMNDCVWVDINMQLRTKENDSFKFVFNIKRKP